MSEMYDDETLNCFVQECMEGIEKLESNVLDLENANSDSQIVNNLLRVFHSIKGASGFFGFKKLETIAHKSENILVKIRDKMILPNRVICDLLLKSIDSIKYELQSVESEKKESSSDVTALIQDLINLDQQKTDVQPLSSSKLTEEVVSKVNPTVNPTVEQAPRKESTVRVDVALLEKLLNLTGELTLANNRISATGNSLAKDPAFRSALRQLNSTTSEVSEVVMRTRLQSVSVLFGKLPRIVRDLSQQCGKKVNVELQGENTELDRAVLEQLKDPLTHIVRNSLDHGIEVPDKRRELGKDETGKLIFKAYSESGFVVIEIKDDGAGVNIEKVKKKALEKGLVTEANLLSMNEQDAARLIFLAGFSTADQISNLSGRGVGMDVVKSNIEALGGIVDLVSKSGQGMTIKLRVPLTMAVMPSLMFKVGKHVFALPKSEIKEVLSIELGSNNLLEYRNRLIPVVAMNKILNLPEENNYKLIVISLGNFDFALKVNQILHIEDIVVKPLDILFENLKYLSGASLLGSGQIALILDPVGLLEIAGIKQIEKQQSETPSHSKGIENIGKQYLVFELDNKTRAAIEMTYISSITKVVTDQIETQNGHEFFYLGKNYYSLLDLNSIYKKNRILKSPQEISHEISSQSVVIVNYRGTKIGLKVNKVLEAIRSNEECQKIEGVDYAFGCLKLGEHLVDVLDVSKIIVESNINILQECA